MLASPPLKRSSWQPWLNWGRGFRPAVACHVWGGPERIRSSKELKNFKRLLKLKLEGCASEARLARSPNFNTTCQQFLQPPPPPPKHRNRPVPPEGRWGVQQVAVTLVRGTKSSHSTPAASQLSSHTVGELHGGVWKKIMLWAIHTQSASTF